MMPRLYSFTLLVLLATSCTVNAAKRRSRIDLPIAKPADAPLEDNIATASGSEVVAEKLEASAPPPTPMSSTEPQQQEVTDVESSSSSESSSEEAYNDDCDVDNVSFELVTG